MVDNLHDQDMMQQAPARPTGERTMTEPQSLWDYLEAGKTRQESVEHAERARSRTATIKKLRNSGHWLTLLRVARTIPQPFTLNDISVAVWHACPDFFGMKGYPYPDNHKVHYILYGDRGLIAKGLIQRISQGLFRVPDNIDIEKLNTAPDSDRVKEPAEAKYGPGGA
jgi:hypothetical protein